MSRAAGWVLVTFVCAGLAGLILRHEEAAVIRGLMIDDRGEPVAGARVSVPGGPPVTSAVDGTFRLPRSNSRQIVVASRPGYFNAASRIDHFATLVLRPIPSSDCASYQWVDPRPGRGEFQCANCHPGIFEEWRAGAHGERSRFEDFFHGRDSRGNPVGWGLMSEHPEGADVCASCHHPAPLPTGKTRHWIGVHCDFCHKVAGSSGGEIGLTHGRFGFTLRRPDRGQLIFGPLGDTARPENSPNLFLRDPMFCASCHEGTVFGVRVYETWSEWQTSPAGLAGVSCQDCHMKPTGQMSNLAPGHGGVERDPATLANHTFFARDQQAMLRDALRLDLMLDRRPEAVIATVIVTARGVGHRIPTGLPDRNLELVVTAHDVDGRPVLHTAGPTLPPFAGSAGHAGELFAKVLRDWEGKRPVPFWRASPEFDDSRLRPNQARQVVVRFPPTAARIAARLVYRRFWPEMMRTKGWPDEAWVVGERSQ